MKNLTQLLRFPCLLIVALSMACQDKDHEIITSAAAPIQYSSARVNAVGTCNFNFTDTDVATNWKLKWSDDFTGSQLNASLWNVWYGGAYNSELQLYKSNNLSVANGNLVITAKRETATGPKNPYTNAQKSFKFTSGRIESKLYFTPSTAYPNRRLKIAARIKLPNSYGMWPAFWTYGDNWPTNGEIDIMENRGQEPDRYSVAYHYGTQLDKDLTEKYYEDIISSSSLTSCYHVYEVEWDQNTFILRFDGKTVKTYTNGTFPYVSAFAGKPEKVVLNLAIGGNFFTNLVTANILPSGTALMYVDWVKVYAEP